MKTDPERHSQRDPFELLHLEQREEAAACIDFPCEGQGRDVPWIQQAADNRYLVVIGLVKRGPMNVAIVHILMALCATGILRAAHIMRPSWSNAKFEAYSPSRISPLVPQVRTVPPQSDV